MRYIGKEVAGDPAGHPESRTPVLKSRPMKYRRSLTILSWVIVVLSAVAASAGIFSSGGPGPYQIESVRGETVTLWGEGLYRHMSRDVAPQGIAQDYVTLFLGIPMLVLGLAWARRGSLKGNYLLAGVLAYFLVTYLFYLVMGMYNAMFLVYAALLGCSFFAFAQSLFALHARRPREYFRDAVPHRWAGGFLILNSLVIALMWLGVVVPPLLDGSIIPPEAEHYTTLIVQGLDLGLLLPLAFVSGWLFMRQRPFGYLLAPVYLVFLVLLMSALTAKVVAMGVLGQETMPAIVIIPAFGLAALVFAVLTLQNLEVPYEHAS